MASVNKWIGIGNLGRDPEVRYRPDGSAICNITIACSSQWKDKSTGENREETEWVRVVFYNRLAEIAGEYLRKGKPVYIEGRIKTRKWQDKSGQDRYTTEIVADQMQMLGGRESGNESAEPTASRQAPAAPARPTAPSNYQAAKDGNLADLESDIPF